jgi:hypothetical protein
LIAGGTALPFAAVDTDCATRLLAALSGAQPDAL